MHTSAGMALLLQEAPGPQPSQCRAARLDPSGQDACSTEHPRVDPETHPARGHVLWAHFQLFCDENATSLSVVQLVVSAWMCCPRFMVAFRGHSDKGRSSGGGPEGGLQGGAAGASLGLSSMTLPRFGVAVRSRRRGQGTWPPRGTPGYPRSPSHPHQGC